MSKAAETIWTAPTSGRCHVGFDTMSMNYTIKYRRADLPLTTDQLLADPRVKALVEALGDMLSLFSADGVILTGTHLKATIRLAEIALAQLKESKP